MDRDYTSPSALGYAQQQQQQQFGGYPPPQHQQFPPSVHRPFIPTHPPLQQFPYHQQFQPHQPPSHHPHLGHLQQPPPNFPPHLLPHLTPSPFRGPFDSSPPPPAPPPSDPELQKRIDKLVEYSAKNGPEFEAMIREKQQDNPAYSFLFGGEGHSYYRYKLFISTRPPGGPFNPMFPGASSPLMHPPPNPMMNAPPNAGASGPIMGGPQMLQHPFPPFYDHQQPFPGHGRPEYDQSSSKPFKAMSGPLPPDVAMELNNVLNSLSGTKESIKGAKTWFMQRSNFAPALAEALMDRVYAVDDCERQLHIIYLVNDILFDSLQRRINPHELDNEALAFRPILGSILARVYHNPQEKEENQSRLQKILQFWASKEVYDQNTIYALEGEMLGGPLPNSFAGTAKDLADPSMVSGQQTLQTTNANIPQWQQDKQGLLDHQLPDKKTPMVPSMPQQPLVNQQFLPGSQLSSSVLGSMHIPSTIPLANQQPPAYMLPTPPASSIGEKVPPYPLFPPGLIPGMVRKMQIGSGVPYSPMSPLDIPTVIPPSNISPTETLERVSKFFKEIGEVNPSEGPMGSKDTEDDDYEYKRDSPVRKGGACIPPPMNLQVDPETGTYPDGTVETKPGSSSSGRLGLGATANPNEVSQYDDVYTSYRKQRSTNYHSSMSLRAATR